MSTETSPLDKSPLELLNIIQKKMQLTWNGPYCNSSFLLSVFGIVRKIDVFEGRFNFAINIYKGKIPFKLFEQISKNVYFSAYVDDVYFPCTIPFVRFLCVYIQWSAKVINTSRILKWVLNDGMYRRGNRNPTIEITKDVKGIRSFDPIMISYESWHTGYFSPIVSNLNML